MYVISAVHYKQCLHPKKVGGGHRASPPLQKVGGHVPLSTHGSMPMHYSNYLQLHCQIISVMIEHIK